MLRFYVPCALAFFLCAPLLAVRSNDGNKIVAAASLSSDQFGSAVAVQGNQALVGASFSDQVANQGGAAYLCDLPSGTVALTLDSGQTAVGDLFGSAVALGPNHAVVGAREAPAGSSSSGVAYIFERSSGSLLHVLQPADLGNTSKFGTSLALDGDRVVVGAPFGGAGVSATGAAYVFDLNTGEQKAKLLAPDGVAGDFLGGSVAIRDGIVLVGAPAHSPGGISTGAAYVFDGTSGALLFKLTASDGVAGDSFGGSVALGGGVAVIGAIGRDDLGSTSGAAYVYSLSTGQEIAKLLPEDGSTFDLFGDAVAMNDQVLAISSPGENGFGIGQDIGAVYLFDTQSFAERAKLIPSGIGPEDQLGFSVALQGDYIVAGAPWDDEAGSNAGAAYWFPIDSELLSSSFCGGSGCPCGNDSGVGGCLNSTNQGGQLLAKGTSSLACDDAVFTARRIPLNSFGLVFMGSSSQPPVALADGLLCLSGDLFRFGVRDSGPGGRIVEGPGVAAQACALFGAGGCLVAGSTWQFQAWVRDSGGPCGSGSNTTNAVSVTFVP